MRLWFGLIVGVLGIAVLAWLGLWQVQRLAWKQDLLARIDAQIAADPVPLADAITTSPYERYLPVTFSGTFDKGHIRMLASRKTTGAVHRIIRPFDADGVGRVLIDTGWQRADIPVAGAPQVRLTLAGNLDFPNEADRFTPAPNLAGNQWFARDVPAMAQSLDTRPVLVVLRDAPDFDLGVTPWPVDSAGISNDHLQYAITWFSLALIWGAMTGYFLLRNRRSPR
jgi:surfeit locus 1 family protein